MCAGREFAHRTRQHLRKEESDEDSPEKYAKLSERLREASWDDEPGRKLFNIPVALSIMVFFALCSQCAATLATIKRETNSWKWPLFSFTYMTVLATLLCLSSGRAAFAVKPGDRSIDFSLKDLAGHTVKLSSLKGKVVVVDVWGTF